MIVSIGLPEHLRQRRDNILPDKLTLERIGDNRCPRTNASAASRSALVEYCLPTSRAMRATQRPRAALRLAGVTQDKGKMEVAPVKRLGRGRGLLLGLRANSVNVFFAALNLGYGYPEIQSATFNAPGFGL
jgi:hypothetical protein